MELDTDWRGLESRELLLGENRTRESCWRWSWNDRDRGRYRDNLKYSLRYSLRYSYRAKLKLRLMDMLIKNRIIFVVAYISSPSTGASAATKSLRMRNASTTSSDGSTTPS